jgi:uncharacterized protein YegP (UPF0339 family)
MSRVEIYQSDNDMGAPSEEWRWRVKAGNNEIVASGEGYSSKRDAKRGFLDAYTVMREAYESLQDS